MLWTRAAESHTELPQNNFQSKSPPGRAVMLRQQLEEHAGTFFAWGNATPGNRTASMGNPGVATAIPLLLILQGAAPSTCGTLFAHGGTENLRYPVAQPANSSVFLSLGTRSRLTFKIRFDCLLRPLSSLRDSRICFHESRICFRDTSPKQRLLYLTCINRSSAVATVHAAAAAAGA